MSFSLDMETITENRVFEIVINTESSYKLSSFTSFLSILDFYFIYAQYVAAKNSGVKFGREENWAIEKIALEIIEKSQKYHDINSTLFYIHRDHRFNLDNMLNIALKLQRHQLSLSPDVMEISQGSIKISILLPIVLISLCGFEFTTDGIDVKNKMHIKKTHIKVANLGEGIEQIAKGIIEVRRALIDIEDK